MSDRQRHRITTAEVVVDNCQFTLTFKEEGMLIHEKFQPTKKDRLITMGQLVNFDGEWKPGETPALPCKAGAKANPVYKDGSIAETFDVAANDLCLLAQASHLKTKLSREELAASKESLLKAMKYLRSLETLAE